MNQESIIKAIKEAKEKSKKRKFNQSFELIINLTELDLKKPEHQLETWINLPNINKNNKICGLIGPELKESTKGLCDTIVMHDDFIQYAKDKKLTKKLANNHEFFIGQANIMPDIAKTFGRILGTKGKMPNPKAGCVVPPNANIKVLVENLKKTIKIRAKTQPSIKCKVGTEDMKEEEIAENIATIHKQVLHLLPKEKNNIKNILIKLTMGKPVKISEK
jgi:large subunit ribosomal protein L1